MSTNTERQSNSVRYLQQQLVAHGFKLIIDGILGRETVQAVRDFQHQRHLPVTGVVDRHTESALILPINARLLSPDDLYHAAHLLGVPAASVATVAHVENYGAGFDAIGRPALLFDRLQFYRRLLASGMRKTTVATHVAHSPNLVHPRHDAHIHDLSEYERFTLASEIDKNCAIEAGRWGMFQIMGLHWARLGYVDPLDFMLAMHQSEGAQLDAFCKFILTDRALLRALQLCDWRTFARLYNGPSFKTDLYDIKLAQAFSIMQSIYPLPLNTLEYLHA
jgi:hypothetical protein